jgi:hypothetical protein
VLKRDGSDFLKSKVSSCTHIHWNLSKLNSE